MEIKGIAHCFFEQSGTFKNQFIKLGIKSKDYDIQNEYGETDCIIDLFAEIEKAYQGKKSIFDTIRKEDIILAFFPCIYFSGISNVWFSLTQRDYKEWTKREIIENVIEREKKRAEYFIIINKLCCIVLEKGLRMIIENPYSMNHYFKSGFLKPPTIIDYDRTRRGDYYVKPTGFWFWNCEPTYGESFQAPSKRKSVLMAKQAKEKGLCSAERSLISQEYAKNFICDFIIGKKQEYGQISFL